MAGIRYIDVCSGISAPTMAWKPLGWEALCFAEIEAFPRAVLAHHYPDVPLNGDFTQIKGDEYGPVDLLVGGTPCQSFSVAGLRKGLNDDRGNLTLQFLKLAQRAKPEWIVWENVPGVISDKTQALAALLDGLEELGYVVDIDILDAQYFGVPQRRRRVFICGQKASSILKQRTLTSALTLVQCLAESLLLTLAALSDRSKLASESCGFDVSDAVLSLKRRIKLFGLDSAEAVSNLAASLAVIQRSSALAQSGSASASGSANCATSGVTKSAGPGMGGAFPSIGKSSKSILADALATMNECITSTATSETTASRIYGCAMALLHIAAPITQSMESSPSFWSAVSSSSTALKEFIDYARSASSDLFTDLEWLQPWHDFVEQAVQLHDSFQRFTVQNFEQVLPVANSLSGDTPPRREKGQNAPTIPSRSSAGGGLGTDFDCDGGLIEGYALQGGGRTSQGSQGSGWKQGTSFTLNCMDEHAVAYVPPVAGCLETTCDDYSRADGFTMIAFSAKDHGGDAQDNLSPTLRAGGHSGSHANAGVMPAVAFDCVSPTLKRDYGKGYGDGEMSAGGLIGGSAVRRLTPRECERLQGFPDDFTKVPYRGRSADECADGPRYKALGNSMAVPVLTWLGQRLQMVEAITQEARDAA